MKKKKPNYKLRRNIAKAFVVLIILIPIFMINKTKIMHAPLYISNSKYSEILDAFFQINYDTKETKDILDKLKTSKVIDKVDSNYIIELSDKGYSHNSINYMILNLNKSDLKKMINKKIDKDFDKYISLDLFKWKNYFRYKKYQTKYPKLTIDGVVTRVELNLDYDQYEETVEEKDPNSLTALVNKHRYISKDYVPDDLVDMEDGYANNMFGVKEIRKETYEHFKKMVDAAKKEDIIFYAESAYRDYDYQKTLYNDYVETNGQEEADKYAAKAGFSEHQLGTTLDIANVWTIEEGDKEYNWIEKNGYKYGFIFRYKKKYEDITGYAEEGWHIRYVGVEAATEIHKKGISFDEYWIKYINKKSSK